MRYLIEAKDAGDDKGAWLCFVVHTEGVEHGLNKLRMEYRNCFLAAGEMLFNNILGKVHKQLTKGMWAEGDDIMFVIEGCTFQISAIADSKH